MRKLFVLTAVILIITSSACRKNNENDETEGTSAPTSSLTTSSLTETTLPPPSEVISTSTTEPVILPPENYDNPIVMTAEGLIGIDFKENGDSPSEGFDNSGFIYYVLRENGYISCPRQLSAQLDWGHNVGYEEIKVGDLVYFSDVSGGSPTFGGIYAGGGFMIYSPYPGEKVKKADITGEYFKSRFVAAISL